MHVFFRSHSFGCAIKSLEITSCQRYQASERTTKKDNGKQVNKTYIESQSQSEKKNTI